MSETLLHNPVVVAALRLVDILPRMAPAKGECPDCRVKLAARRRVCDLCRIVRRKASRQRWWDDNGAEWRQQRSTAA